MEILNSKMANEELVKVQARRDELSNTIQEKRSLFENETVENREIILNDVESAQKELNELNEREKELKEMEEKFVEQEKRFSSDNAFVPTQPKEERNVAETVEYRDAWINYVKTGKTDEVRALTTGTANIPVPTMMQQYVNTVWEEYGELTNLCNVTNIKGIVELPYEAAADDAVWHEEGAAAIAEENITFGMVELKPAMIKKYIALTDELMGLTGEEFIKYIADELVYRVVLLLEHSIIAGNLVGGKGVEGVVNSALATKVTKALTFNAVNEAIARLKTTKNLTVVMNQTTFFKDVMGLMDTTGRPIYQIAADNTGKPQYFINGIKVLFSSALAAYDAATTAPYMVVGNFKDYRLNLPNGNGVETLVDPYTLATEDKVRFIGKLFAAGKIAKPNTFAYVVAK